jgi:hypothetical protein
MDGLKMAAKTKVHPGHGWVERTAETSLDVHHAWLLG